MDSVMAALLIASFWASVRALETRRPGWVLAAAALIGVAFNVKLSEALVPLPGLAVMWWAALPRRRTAVLAGAATVLALVGMAWIVVASLTPIGHRPYPIGSKTGSIYRVVFAYNGLDRLRGAPQLGPTDPTTPGPLRLLGPRANDNQLIGTELIAGLALALGLGLVDARQRRGRPAPDDGSPPDPEHERVASWTAAGLGLWLLAALVLFSAIGHLQTRYLEAGTPAAAAAVGVSAAGLLARAVHRADARRTLAAALGACGLYALLTASDSLGRAAAGLGLAVALALVAGRANGRRWWTRSTGLSVLTGLALLAAPARSSLDLIDRNSGNAPQVGSGAQYGPYLHAHRRGAPYEVASSDPLGVVGLIAADDQPVLILNDIKGPLVRLATLKQLVGRGGVRYVLLAHPCTTGFRCPSTTSWSLRHATRIRGYLYRFATAGDPARTAAAA
jgi:4-amino-4-deoxy-L-arabinose transferase-like glycosyltransferase